MVRRPHPARTSVDTETRPLPHSPEIAPDTCRARPVEVESEIDCEVLAGLLAAMEPEERGTILSLCAKDLETARLGTRHALHRDDREALERHLHVMSALAQTIGAQMLANDAARMQIRLREGGIVGVDADSRLMDVRARRAVQFLKEPAQ